MKIILTDAVDTFVIEGEGVSEPMHNLLENFPNTKIVVSGANDEQYMEFGLEKVPYEVFTLKHNPEKTDPRYFEILLEKYSLTAAVKSAESVGINSYWYDPKTRDVDSLKQFLTENLD